MNEPIETENKETSEAVSPQITPNVEEQSMSQSDVVRQPMESSAIEPQKTKKSKPWIWLGLVLILIVAAGVIGTMFLNKTPEKIFKTVVNNVVLKANKTIEKLDWNSIKSLEEQPISMNGTLSFDTDMDLNGIEEFSEYNYNFSLVADYKQKILQASIAMNEDNEQVLSANINIQNNKGYLKIPELLNKTFDIGEVDMEDYFNIDIPETSFNNQDIMKFLSEMGEMFNETIDPNKLSVNKNVTKDYNGKDAKTEEIIYTLDGENQKRTLNELRQKMLNNDEFLTTASKITNEDKDSLKSSLENATEASTSGEDITITITTEGILKNIIGISISTDNDELKYVNYNGEKSIYYEDYKLTIVENGNNDATIKIASSDFNGELNIKVEKESKEKSKIEMSIKADGTIEKEKVNFSIDLSLNSNMNDTSITKINTSDAITIDELTTDEQAELLTNFQKITSQTPLRNFF